MNIFTDKQKKAIARALVEEAEFFIYDGVAYVGNQGDEEQAFGGWIKERTGKRGGVTENPQEWREWLSDTCIELSDYKEDDYLVCTDEEADEKAKEYIEDTLWAFNPWFLAEWSGVDHEVFEAIQSNERYEGNNDAILRLIGDNLGDLVHDAIATDGRGHFLSSYDGEEHEVNLSPYTGENEYFYVYRLN